MIGKNMGTYLGTRQILSLANRRDEAGIVTRIVIICTSQF